MGQPTEEPSGLPWSSSTVKRKLGLLICEEGESDVCQGARARKMMDLTQIWKGGLKTKESPQQSQAPGTFRGGGSRGVGRHQGG